MASFDRNRADGDFENRESYPAELFPAEIVSEGIHFNMGGTKDEENNVVDCKGQTISLPSGNFNKVYILAASAGDLKGEFLVGSQPVNLTVQSWTGFIGQFYNRILTPNGKDVLNVKEAFVKNSNIAWYASHLHKRYPTENEAYKYSYIYKYEIDLPKNVASITLPKNDKIKVFAITFAQKLGDDVQVLQPLMDDFKENKSYKMRN